MNVLLVILIALVAVFLFFNLYSRKKLLSSYRKLQKAGISFDTGHIFNKELREKEIHPEYPGHIDEIEHFCRQIRDGLKYAGILFTTILGLGILIVIMK